MSYCVVLSNNFQLRHIESYGVKTCKSWRVVNTFARNRLSTQSFTRPSLKSPVNKPIIHILEKKNTLQDWQALNLFLLQIWPSERRWYRRQRCSQTCSSGCCSLSGQLRASKGQKFIHLFCTHPKILMMVLAAKSWLSKMIKIRLLDWSQLCLWL